MSADNFIQIRKFENKWWYADLSASQYWSEDWDQLEVPKSNFTYGPFDSVDEAYDHADANVPIIEYDVVVYTTVTPKGTLELETISTMKDSMKIVRKLYSR